VTILEYLINIILLILVIFTLNTINGLKQLKRRKINEEDTIHTACSDDFIGK
jgi:hypothetical protein